MPPSQGTAWEYQPKVSHLPCRVQASLFLWEKKNLPRPNSYFSLSLCSVISTALRRRTASIRCPACMKLASICLWTSASSHHSPHAPSCPKTFCTYCYLCLPIFEVFENTLQTSFLKKHPPSFSSSLSSSTFRHLSQLNHIPSHVMIWTASVSLLCSLYPYHLA